MVLANLEDVNVVDGKVNALSNNLPRNYYNKSEVDQKISEIPAGKDYDDQIAEINSELGNRYTKAQTDKKISDEIKKIPVPKDYDEDIERVDGELANRYTKSETYTKTEVQEYVTQHGGESVPDDIVLWENPTEVEVPSTSQPLHRFSSEEKVVGYWVDGKPIYEKTYYNSISTFMNGSTWYDTEIPTEEKETIVDCKFTNFNGTPYPISITKGVKDGYLSGMHYRNAGMQMNGNYTIQYTKTTDRGND